LCPKVDAPETPLETCRARPWRAQRPSGGSRRTRRKSTHAGSHQAVAPAPFVRDTPCARSQRARASGASCGNWRAGARTETRTILHGKMSWSGLLRSVALSHSLPLSASHMLPLGPVPVPKKEGQIAQIYELQILHPVPYRGSGGMRRACSALALVLALGRVVATAAFVTGPPSAGGARRQWCVFSCLCVGGFVCSAPRRNPQRERALTAPVQKDIALQLLASLRGRGDGARSL